MPKLMVGEKLVTVAVRITRVRCEEIDQAASACGRDRSQQLRAMLAFAHAGMPAGWAPGDPLVVRDRS